MEMFTNSKNTFKVNLKPKEKIYLMSTPQGHVVGVSKANGT